MVQHCYAVFLLGLSSEIPFRKQENVKYNKLKTLLSKKKTSVSPNAMLEELQIDHVKITTRNRKEILNVDVRKSLRLGPLPVRV